MNKVPERTSFDDGDKKLKFSDLFELKEILGNGAFGQVVSARQKNNQKDYAVKVIQPRTADLTF